MVNKASDIVLVGAVDMII